jgi:hypothetical protein
MGEKGNADMIYFGTPERRRPLSKYYAMKTYRGEDV